MRVRIITTVTAFVLLLAGTDVRAQGFLTPQFGGHFGGGTVGSRTLTVGGSAGFMVDFVGFEVDYGFAKDFFPDTHPSSHLHVVGDLATLMANVVVGTFARNELGGPYVSGGLGTIRIAADEPSGLISTRGSDLGYNVGAGAIGFFTDGVGIRGDVRYFRDIRSEELTAVEGGSGAGPMGPGAGEPHHTGRDVIGFGRFGFWRATVGITFRF